MRQGHKRPPPQSDEWRASRIAPGHSSRFHPRGRGTRHIRELRLEKRGCCVLNYSLADGVPLLTVPRVCFPTIRDDCDHNSLIKLVNDPGWITYHLATD